jgi:hypothetical protein
MNMVLLILGLLTPLILILFLLYRWRPRDGFLKAVSYLLFSFFSLSLARFCFLGGTIYWVTDPYHFKDPSDEKLITLFYQHRGVAAPSPPSGSSFIPTLIRGGLGCRGKHDREKKPHESSTMRGSSPQA